MPGQINLPRNAFGDLLRQGWIVAKATFLPSTARNVGEVLKTVMLRPDRQRLIAASLAAAGSVIAVTILMLSSDGTIDLERILRTATLSAVVFYVAWPAISRRRSQQ